MCTETVDEKELRTVLKEAQRREHPDCIFCSGVDSLGIELDWKNSEEGGLRVEFCCDARFQSYRGIVHGGVISLLFDGAMTNLLFAEGKRAVTGELTIRYLKSVGVGSRLQIAARIVCSRSPLHIVEAKLSDDDGLLATARAKFMEKTPAALEKVAVST